jgi:rhodanese-related sulfurtransferase
MTTGHRQPGPQPRRQALRRLVLMALAVSASTALLPACSDDAAAPDPQRVSLEEARQLFEAKQALMFDIREADEHATGVANGALLLPTSQLKQRLREIPQDPAQPVLIICQTQSRSSQVVKALKEAGWTNVRYVHGGMSGWARNGWPLVKPFGLPAS